MKKPFSHGFLFFYGHNSKSGIRIRSLLEWHGVYGTFFFGWQSWQHFFHSTVPKDRQMWQSIF